MCAYLRGVKRRKNISPPNTMSTKIDDAKRLFKVSEHSFPKGEVTQRVQGLGFAKRGQSYNVRPRQSALGKHRSQLKERNALDTMLTTAKLYENAVNKPWGVELVQEFKATRRRATRAEKRKGKRKRSI